MQAAAAIMSPAGRSTVAPPSAAAYNSPSSLLNHRRRRHVIFSSNRRLLLLSSSSHSPLSSSPSPPHLYTYNYTLSNSSSTGSSRFLLLPLAAAYSSPPPPPQYDDPEKAKLAQVAKRLEKTSKNFRRLGSFGFWGQLVCTFVASIILSFSVVATGKIGSPGAFYATAGGIVAAFISVFFSFGYIRLSEKLRKTAKDPSKAPPRADVVKSLRNGIVLNLVGMGAAILGLQATVGLLVAKALTTSANPYNISPGTSPVLALDVFLVQASANTVLSHFLGLASSLELLRSVTLPPSENVPVPKMV